MEESGTVISVSDGRAKVKMRRWSGCEGCISREYCRDTGNEEVIVEVENPIRATIGNRVTVSLPPALTLKAGIIYYLLPLVAFVFGAFLGGDLISRLLPRYNPDLLAILSALILLVSTGAGIRLYTRHSHLTAQEIPRIIRIIE